MDRNWLLKISVVLIVLAMLFGSQQTALANTRTVENGELPFYARIEVTDGVWVAVIFYNSPECVPPDFNLLDMFDFSGSELCQSPTTEGFMVWKNGPEVDLAPILSQLKGRGAVPVWFVSYDEFLEATADEVLTIGELTGLPSLQEGFASFYQETLRPIEGAVTTTVLIEASGSMVDGRDFKLHFNGNKAVYNAKITFSD